MDGSGPSQATKGWRLPKNRFRPTPQAPPFSLPIRWAAQRSTGAAHRYLEARLHRTPRGESGWAPHGKALFATDSRARPASSSTRWRRCSGATAHMRQRRPWSPATMAPSGPASQMKRCLCLKTACAPRGGRTSPAPNWCSCTKTAAVRFGQDATGQPSGGWMTKPTPGKRSSRPRPGYRISPGSPKWSRASCGSPVWKAASGNWIRPRARRRNTPVGMGCSTETCGTSPPTARATSGSPRTPDCPNCG